MDFIKIKTDHDGAARYINLEQIVTVEDTERGFKLKMSNGELITDATSAKAEILQKITPRDNPSK